MAGLLGGKPIKDSEDVPAMAGEAMKGDMPARREMDEEEDAGEPATPEEQQQYEELFEKGWELIADEEGGVRPAILKMLDSDPSDLRDQLGEEAMAEVADQLDPANALAATTAAILLRLAQSAQENGITIMPASLVEAGKDLLGDLAELAEKQGLAEYDDAALSRAAVLTATIYGKAALETGLITQEQLDEDYQMLQQADQDGSLAAMLGGA